MEIGILDANIKYCNDLCSILNDLDFQARPIHTLENLSAYLKEDSLHAVIINIDTMNLNNTDIKNLSRKYRKTTFLCISESRFHPDFKEAIRNHIFACLNKPIDTNELNYFLKSIKKSRFS